MAQVPMNNRQTVTLGGVEYELECSLGAMATYSDEFAGGLDEPYSGFMDRDVLLLWNRSRETVEEDGKEVPNKDFRGIDVTGLVRVMWAMAFAAGSTRKHFGEFAEEVMRLPVSAVEEAALFATVVYVLGGNIIFRQPEGQGGAGAPDDEEAA